MRKITLFCCAGMSTSLLVTKMTEYCETINYEVNIAAYPVAAINEHGPDSDIILLGPQVRYELKRIQKLLPEKIVESIDMKAYGRMNGKAVIDHVKEVLGDN